MQEARAKLFPGKVTDPSPELPGSELWVRLLELSKKYDDPYLYGHLLFFRLMGCELKENKKHGYVIRPVEGCWPEGLYEQCSKELLGPYRQEVLSLLKGLSDTPLPGGC
jgi:hypothetical protein